MPRRDPRFSEAGCQARWYMGGDPVQSGFLSALSATFPLGEKFFIDSVRAYKAQVDGALAQDVADFIRQEAVHTREHVAFNALVSDLGYDTSRMTERTRRALAKFYAKSQVRQLGVTIALEHFTALFAWETLSNPGRLACAPDNIRALWRWHCMEEIEHKGVCFDTFLAATRGWSPLRRYLFRSRAVAEATWNLFQVVVLNMHDLFRQDDLPLGRTWARALVFFFSPRGFLTRVLPGHLAWFAPGFHPWKHDDRHLAQEVAEEMASWTAASSGLAAA